MDLGKTTSPLPLPYREILNVPVLASHPVRDLVAVVLASHPVRDLVAVVLASVRSPVRDLVAVVLASVRHPVQDLAAVLGLAELLPWRRLPLHHGARPVLDVQLHLGDPRRYPPQT